VRCRTSERSPWHRTRKCNQWWHHCINRIRYPTTSNTDATLTALLGRIAHQNTSQSRAWVSVAIGTGTVCNTKVPPLTSELLVVRENPTRQYLGGSKSICHWFWALNMRRLAQKTVEYCKIKCPVICLYVTTKSMGVYKSRRMRQFVLHAWQRWEIHANCLLERERQGNLGMGVNGSVIKGMWAVIA
jgi:hypothetical protein